MFGKKNNRQLSEKELKKMINSMSEKEAKKLKKAIERQEEEDFLDMFAMLECFMDD